MSFDNHESTSGSEYASPDELKRVFDRMEDWLRQNGEFLSSSFTAAPYEDTGLLLYTPHDTEKEYYEDLYTYEITAQQLNQEVPEAVTKLDMQGKVQFRYSSAHYIQEGEDEEPQFYPARFTVFYDTSDKAEIDITIGIDDAHYGDGVVTSHRTKISGADVWPANRTDKATPETLQKRVEEFIASKQFEYELGANKLTKDECGALQEIAGALEQLK